MQHNKGRTKRLREGKSECASIVAALILPSCTNLLYSGFPSSLSMVFTIQSFPRGFVCSYSHSFIVFSRYFDKSQNKIVI